MNSEEHKHEKALDMIGTGKVKMRPRWYFLGKTALLITGTILLLLVILFLASFAVFATRQTGVWFVPSFGIRRFGFLLRSLPWLIIILVLVFSTILEFLVQQYSFGYRRPLLYSMIGIMFIAIMGGIFLEMTPIHRGLFRFARRGQLPLGGMMYRQFGGGMMDSHIIAGNIVSTSTGGFLILTPRDEKVLLKLNSSTEIPSSTDFDIGDAVVAFGNRDDGTNFTAMGIRKIVDPMHFPSDRVFDRDGDEPGVMMPPPGMMRFYGNSSSLK